MVFLNATTIIVMIVIGAISFLSLLAILFMFGRLIFLQFRIWMLARKGYHMVEHVGLNRVRNYFYLKPTNNKFDFKSGFYLHYPETTTKSSDILPQTPKGTGGNWVFRKFTDKDNDDQIEKLKVNISKMVYDSNAVTLKWGIPMITYVGNSPYPINFSEPEKEYGAQVIRDVYIRLLATAQFKDLQRIILIGLIALGVIAAALVALYFAYKGNASNAATCLSMLNSTTTKLLSCTAENAVMLAQNSTMVI